MITVNVLAACPGTSRTYPAPTQHPQRPLDVASGTRASTDLWNDLAMIIVSGTIYVEEAERDRYVQGCREMIVAARTSDGCIDFHLAADPIDRDRINVYEQWKSVEAVESFRGSGPSSEQAAAIRDAHVFQHEVASSTRL